MNPAADIEQVSSTADIEEQDLIALLRARGRRVTSQRLLILRELRRVGHHATAEQIYQAVHPELPGMSVPTVYATLDLLVELGLARKIDAGIGISLYDARTEPHQHTVCRRCGRIDDIDGELDLGGLLREASATGFRADGAELVVSGLCASCAAGWQSEGGAKRRLRGEGQGARR